MTDGRSWTPGPLARGTHGAVVAPHHLASAAGLAILRAGGSAVDAAIATNAVLGVVTPQSCGLGGDAFWLIWDAAAGHQVALNGSGRAPAGADAAALRQAGHETIPLRGPLAITVPGAVRSWADAHTRFGRLSPADLMAPAVQLASDGFPASGRFVDAVERTAPLIESTIGSDAPFLRVYRPSGRRWRPGERVRNRALAVTLQAIATGGFEAFDRGDVGSRRARGWMRPAARSRSTTSATTPRPGRIRSRSTIAASWSRPIRPTAPGSSRSRSWPSSPSSSRPAGPRSARTG